MNRKIKIKRILYVLLITIVVGILSNFLVRNVPIESFSIFDTVSLFTYFGVLIGFALTIYTFGLSMLSDIRKKISQNDKFSEDKKKELYNTLVRSFNEIKGDIWIIFYSILAVVIFSVSKEIVNPFGWEVEQYLIPETANVTLFIMSTIAIRDITKALFNLSEINLELNKN